MYENGLNLYVCHGRQLPVARAVSARNARETPVVDTIGSRHVVDTAVAAARGINDPPRPPLRFFANARIHVETILMYDHNRK